MVNIQNGNIKEQNVEILQNTETDNNQNTESQGDTEPSTQEQNESFLNNDELGDITQIEETINTQRNELNKIMKEHDVVLDESFTNLSDNISKITENNIEPDLNIVDKSNNFESNIR